MHSKFKMVVALGLSFLFFSAFMVVGTFAAPQADPTGTTITVDTTDDELNADGDCSLREAIEAANSDSAVDACPAGNGHDTITLSSGTYALALEGVDNTNSTGDFDILDNLTINGQGSSDTILDGNQINRLIHVITDTMSVELNDLTIRNGRHIVSDTLQSAGGIANQGGALTLNHTTVISNTGSNGGGIYNLGTLTLNHTTVMSNTADGAGGGLYNTGTLTLSNSSVISNTAVLGGGIDNSVNTGGTSILTINDSLISGNIAVNIPDDANSGFGGGIANIVTIGATSGTGEVRINDSTISNNQAFNGGGIGNTIVTAQGFVDLRVTVNRSTISDNTATGNGTQAGNGGGIANVDATLTVINSTLSGNTAAGTGSQVSGLGGGILNGSFVIPASATFINSTISGGNATVGGALVNTLLSANGSATTTFKNSLVAGNSDLSTLAPSCFNQGGTLTSQGHNLEDGNLCNFDQATDLIDSDPMLGQLAANGGSTLTHALPAGSPAIDAADNATCAAAPVNGVDQRGITRTQGSACDIGAYEQEQEVTSVTLATFDRKSPTSWPSIGLAALLFTIASGFSFFGKHLYGRD